MLIKLLNAFLLPIKKKKSILQQLNDICQLSTIKYKVHFDDGFSLQLYCV